MQKCSSLWFPIAWSRSPLSYSEICIARGEQAWGRWRGERSLPTEMRTFQLLLRFVAFLSDLIQLTRSAHNFSIEQNICKTFAWQGKVQGKKFKANQKQMQIKPTTNSMEIYRVFIYHKYFTYWFHDSILLG